MFMMNVLSCQKWNVLHIHACMCVCGEHKDSFLNLFLTTEKRTKNLFPGCSERSTEKKSDSDGDRALCKRNRHPHWVWPPSPWKLKVGSSCRHMTHALLYTQHFRANGWGCLGNRLMENLRGTWALTWLSLLPVTSTSKMICPSSWGLWGRGGLQADEKYRRHVRGLTISKVMNSWLLMNFTACWEILMCELTGFRPWEWKIFQ